MLIPTGKAIYIDIRSSAEVMLYGLANGVDAHIPYLGSPVDEWNGVLQSYRSSTNNSFINGVFELISEGELYRDSAIVLLTRSKRKGVLATSILNVAGYGRVSVKEYRGYTDCKLAVGQQTNNEKPFQVAEVPGGVSILCEFTGLVH